MNNIDKKFQRQTRIRKKIAVVSMRPRLTVFRSNNYCYVQIIDKKGDTLFGLTEKVYQKEKQRQLKRRNSRYRNCKNGKR